MRRVQCQANYLVATEAREALALAVRTVSI